MFAREKLDYSATDLPDRVKTVGAGELERGSGPSCLHAKTPLCPRLL